MKYKCVGQQLDRSRDRNWRRRSSGSLRVRAFRRGNETNISRNLKQWICALCSLTTPAITELCTHSYLYT